MKHQGRRQRKPRRLLTATAAVVAAIAIAAGSSCTTKLLTPMDRCRSSFRPIPLPIWECMRMASLTRTAV